MQQHSVGSGGHGLNRTASSRRVPPALLNGLYVLLLLALALVVFIFFLRTSGIGINGKATFEKVLTGTAYRPYIYRQLLPAVANALAPYVDGMWSLRLGRQAETVLGDRFFRAQLNGRLYPRQVILILGMMYVSLAGFAAVMWLFVRDLGYRRLALYAVPVASLLATTAMFNFGYMYDFTELLLFTLCLWLMVRGSWPAYLLVFALSTLNKETTLLLSLIFCAYYWSRMPRRIYVVLAGAQLAVFALIQGALRYRFRSSPGGSVEWHLQEQIAAYRLILVNDPWVLALWAACAVLIAILVVRGWNRKPQFIRYALIPLPILLPAWFLWGYPLEIRNLMEALPAVIILMLPPSAAAPAAGRDKPRSTSSEVAH